MITAETMRERLEVLRQARRELMTRIHQIDGAVAEAERWLEEKPEKDEGVEESAPSPDPS